jgi:hypothetical protein
MSFGQVKIIVTNEAKPLEIFRMLRDLEEHNNIIHDIYFEVD